ncbi:MAG: AAA family ATPase [Kordiimonadaceae bacterium]|nr:AAA family ATPase [Kordiimonadaceae bacterium]
MVFGQVIVLNGASSSGKSTLAKALQSELSDVYLYVSLDMFWDMTPAAIPASSENFPNLKLAMARSVKSLAETGHNVIVDTVYNGIKSHQDMAAALEGIGLFTVKVSCHADILLRREKSRGDRRLGIALAQLETVHVGIGYDIEIDTSHQSPIECARQIISSL